MKNKLFTVVGITLIASSLVACGSKDAAVGNTGVETANVENTGDVELTEDYPDNFMEERTGQFVYDSQEDIVASLQPGEAYAYAKVLGSDEEVLFITDETFDGYGFPAAISCYGYLPTADGKYQCDFSFASSSTSTPISVSDEGYILQASHTDASCVAIDKNTHAFMYVIYAYLEFGDDGKETYGGFYRETNDVDSTSTEIAADDSSVFEECFAKYTDTNAIHFTVVE